MSLQRDKVQRMPIYQVTSLAPTTEKVDAAVRTHIEEANRYQLPNNAGWFVNFKGTTIELSNAIELTGQAPNVPSPVGSTLITSITSYYGRGSSDMWEWLKTRFEAQ